VLTLSDLAARRAAGTLPRFERVVVETTGLADPAPILHAMMTDRDLSEIYALDGIVTTVDALMGVDTLERHAEALRQVAVADRIVLTKTDLAGALPAPTVERLAAINPGARLLTVVRGAIPPDALFGCGPFDVAAKRPDVQAWLAGEGVPAAHAGHHHRHE